MDSQNKHYDVSAEIDRRPVSAYQLWIFVLCGLVILLDGFDIQVVSFTAPLLAAQVGAKISAFGPVFASGLFGLTIGSLLVGPFADRFGRKRLIQISCFIFGLFTILSAHTASLQVLIAMRFLAGIGLGGCIPNVLALASEFAPLRVRARTVAITVSATPLGAVLGGIACWALIPTMGWHVVYWIGGVVPLVLTVLLGLYLPESIRFMVSARKAPAEIAKLLQRIAPDFVFGADARFSNSQALHQGVAVKQLFTHGSTPRTLLLWVPYFMVFLISFLLSSWLPSVLKEAGLPLSQAMVALMTFNIGGVAGAVILGRLIDRFGVYGVLSIAFLLCALSVSSLGYVAGVYNGILVVIFVVGICVQGTICSLYALASTIYPTATRVTGMGWAAGAGRLGAIFGPLIGGAMLGAGWGMKGMFASASVPALLSIAALLGLKALTDKTAGHRSADATAGGASSARELAQAPGKPLNADGH